MKSKYNVNTPVSWRGVMKCIKLAITYHSQRANWAIEDVQADLEHNYPERLENDVKGAINASERVFYYVGLLNSVRDFLFYDQIKPEKLGISKIYDYYMANH